MKSPLILSRVPFRLPLGGGSTDMPSYYQRHEGFIFGVAINMYMDILIKKPITDDNIHMHYMHYETEPSVENIKHTIGKEALKMTGIRNKVLISFKADTPSGTGLGSSGACSVALLKGLSLFKGTTMSNIEAAEQSFALTQNMGLPDGKQDPYVCAVGGFVVLDIKKNGKVRVSQPVISQKAKTTFVKNTLLFYTGIRRDSKPLLAAQNTRTILKLKHKIKDIGKKVLRSFLREDLDEFGRLLDEHWQLKKGMSDAMTTGWLDDIYATARREGALGGKILGAGGGGYFMFYCPTAEARAAVRKAMGKFNIREVSFAIDEEGARAKVINF